MNKTGINCLSTGEMKQRNDPPSRTEANDPLNAALTPLDKAINRPRVQSVEPTTNADNDVSQDLHIDLSNLTDDFDFEPFSHVDPNDQPYAFPGMNSFDIEIPDCPELENTEAAAPQAQESHAFRDLEYATTPHHDAEHSDNEYSYGSSDPVRGIAASVLTEISVDFLYPCQRQAWTFDPDPLGLRIEIFRVFEKLSAWKQ
ncbi:hypothetical protein FE257_002312 [Aspergillus nanangensis]|uniref:Uncharacterized protein n=1 Tax=Aspergillus nanangensis TaxID=2582783 RepID=A0AAD4GP40_ASPNN|nr:hypothetical protein FE257_002312 [Aspergillus nanangensis]